MENAVIVVAILSGAFLLVMAVDRGIPNLLYSVASTVETVAGAAVASIRATAGRLRERHERIATEQRNGTAAAPAGRNIVAAMLMVDEVPN